MDWASVMLGWGPLKQHFSMLMVMYSLCVWEVFLCLLEIIFFPNFSFQEENTLINKAKGWLVFDSNLYVVVHGQ